VGTRTDFGAPGYGGPRPPQGEPSKGQFGQVVEPLEDSHRRQAATYSCNLVPKCRMKIRTESRIFFGAFGRIGLFWAHGRIAPSTAQT